MTRIETDYELVHSMNFHLASLLQSTSRRCKGIEIRISTLFLCVLYTLVLTSCGITSIRRTDSSYARVSEADAIETLESGPLHIDGNNLFPFVGVRKVREPLGANTYVERTVTYCNTLSDPGKLLTVKNVNAQGISYYSWRYTGVGVTHIAACDVDVSIVVRFVAFDSITKIDVDKNNSFQSYPDKIIALFSHGEVAARFLVATQNKDQVPAYISALLALCHNVR